MNVIFIMTKLKKMSQKKLNKKPKKVKILLF